MKVSKNIKIKLFALVAFLMLMFVQIGPYLLYADENELTFSYKRINLVATNEYYNSNNLFFSEAYVGQNVAYCLDYGVPLPVKSGGTVKYIRTVSNMTTAALVYGYPNVTATSLGVNSDEEAMLATQLAVWRLARATGDSKKSSYILDMANLMPTAGNEEYMSRVKTAAQLIIDRAKAAPYVANPKLELVNNAKVTLNGDKVLVGPYKINGTGFNISSVNVSLESAPASAILCDVNGNVKNSYVNGDDIYVQLSTNDAGSSFNIKVNEKGSHNFAKVYGTGVDGDAKQDYVFLTSYPDDLITTATINVPELNGSIKVVKYDQYKIPLQGVTFELRDTSGKVLKTAKTDAAGIITFNDLKIGRYVVAETSTIDGYVMQNVPVELSVVYNEVTTLEVVNRKIEGGIKIIKMDEDFEKTLPNITFEILDSNKKVIDTIVTNNEGVAVSNKLAIGTYYFREVQTDKTPSNIIVDTTEHKFEITDENDNETQVYKLNNYYTRGKLTIQKTTEDKKPLEGVTFEILDANKKVVDTKVTDANGMLTTKYLKHGKYYYREVNAPASANVIIDPEAHEFEMEFTDKTIPVENKYIKGTLTVVKTGDDGRKLKDVVFEIYDANKNLVDTITTNDEGVATTKELVIGKYSYKEVDAPANVIIDDTEYEFVFTKDKPNITKHIENELIKTGKLKIIKIDELERPVEGVIFKIYDANKNEVDTLTTDKNGEAVSKELVLGSYTYKEVSVPPYVVLDSTEKKFELSKNGDLITKTVVNDLKRGSISIFKVDEKGNYLEGVKFTLLNSDGKEIDSKVTGKDGIVKFENLLPGKYSFKEVDAPAYVVKDDSLKPIEITVDKLNVETTVKNDFARGILKIIKIDELEKPLEGVVFEIYDSNKNVIDTITTDEQGIAVSKKLVIGKYYYSEKFAPPGVIIDKGLYEFNIVTNNDIIEAKIKNDLERGSISIFKVDENGNYLENVTFTLLDNDNHEIESKTTGKDGIVRFDNLLPGKYKFKEVDAPVYVVKSDKVEVIEITVEQLNVEVTVKNDLAKAVLRIHKTDMADNNLEGVTFQILDSNKKVIDTKVTDKNGMIESISLPVGIYYYREVKAEDDNIIIDTKLYEFKITGNNEDVEVEVKNKTVDGVVIITKVDSSNKKLVLQGAKIQILDENKNVIATKTTDENGQVKLGNLKIGKYFYKEIEAPKGYILDSNEYEFTITKEAQERNITFTNEAKKLPQTGGFISTNMLIVIIVAVVSIVGYIIITIIAKNKKEQNN